MATTIKTTFQFRRGTLEEWTSVNPILAAGEPSFVIDTSQYKIGNGIDAWCDLPFQSEGGVFNAPTHYDFPSVGKPNVIYKAESEQTVYQWNSTTLVYEALNSAKITANDIELIYGGNADGTA